MLALFSPELTNPLRMHFGKMASGTYDFLELIYKNIMLPFINVSVTKHHYKLYSKMALFSNASDARLEKAILIANWLTN